MCNTDQKCQCFHSERRKWTSLKCICRKDPRNTSVKNSFLLLLVTKHRYVYIHHTWRGNAFPISSLASPHPQGNPYLSHFAFGLMAECSEQFALYANINVYKIADVPFKYATWTATSWFGILQVKQQQNKWLNSDQVSEIKRLCVLDRYRGWGEKEAFLKRNVNVGTSVYFRHIYSDNCPATPPGKRSWCQSGESDTVEKWCFHCSYLWICHSITLTVLAMQD